MCEGNKFVLQQNSSSKHICKRAALTMTPLVEDPHGWHGSYKKQFYTKKNDLSLHKSKSEKKIAQQIMLLKSSALISFFSFLLTFLKKFSSFCLSFCTSKMEVEVHYFFHFPPTCLDSINFLNFWFSYKESEDTVL